MGTETLWFDKSQFLLYKQNMLYIHIYILFLVVVVVGGWGGAGWWGEVGVGGGVANGIQTCSLISVPTLSLHQKEYFFEHYFSQSRKVSRHF